MATSSSDVTHTTGPNNPLNNAAPRNVKEALQNQVYWNAILGAVIDGLKEQIKGLTEQVAELQNRPTPVDGLPGADGLPGLNAYEIAVQLGFVGTEEEWIASLKGVPGDPGEAREIKIEDLPYGVMTYCEWDSVKGEFGARPLVKAGWYQRVQYFGPLEQNGVNDRGESGPIDGWVKTTGAGGQDALQ